MSPQQLFNYNNDSSRSLRDSYHGAHKTDYSNFCVITLTSTDTEILTTSICTETDAAFTTTTTTIGYYGATSTTEKPKRYHKDPDKECYKDDEVNVEDEY